MRDNRKAENALYGQGEVSVRCFRGVNRISGKVAYIRPLKLQASLRAHDLVQKHKLVDVGQRFGKVSVLATMPGKVYSRKLDRTSNADPLKFNGQSVQIHMNLIGGVIVAFVRC